MRKASTRSSFTQLPDGTMRISSFTQLEPLFAVTDETLPAVLLQTNELELPRLFAELPTRIPQALFEDLLTLLDIGTRIFTFRFDPPHQLANRGLSAAALDSLPLYSLANESTLSGIFSRQRSTESNFETVAWLDGVSNASQHTSAAYPMPQHAAQIRMTQGREIPQRTTPFQARPFPHQRQDKSQKSEHTLVRWAKRLISNITRFASDRARHTEN